MNPDTLLEFLHSRTTIRVFEDRPVPRELLVRVLEAAIRAPSPTNRQPWRFTVVTAAEKRRQILEATRAAVDEIHDLVVAAGKDDLLAGYWDYFIKPQQSAQAFVVVQHRHFQDTIANMIADAGGDPAKFDTAEKWNVEISAASAAIMQLLLQAHAEGLGACWMSGPLLARPRIVELLEIRPPWRMLGGIALGWPAEKPAPTARRPLDKVVEWFEDPPAAAASKLA